MSAKAQHLPLSPNITITSPTPSTMQPLTTLTRTLLPIAYPDKFFTALLQPATSQNAFSLAKVALWTDHVGTGTGTGDDPNQGQGRGQVVGGICGRIMPVDAQSGAGSRPACEGSAPAEPECELYIATLAVLAPWRGQGIAAALLRDLVRAAMEVTVTWRGGAEGSGDGDREGGAAGSMAQGLGRLTGVYAHVWETNEEGLAWYRAQGFEVGDLIKGYYRKLRPDGASVVRRGVTGLVLGM